MIEIVLVIFVIVCVSCFCSCFMSAGIAWSSAKLTITKTQTEAESKSETKTDTKTEAEKQRIEINKKYANFPDDFLSSDGNTLTFYAPQKGKIYTKGFVKDVSGNEKPEENTVETAENRNVSQADKLVINHKYGINIIELTDVTFNDSTGKLFYFNHPKCNKKLTLMAKTPCPPDKKCCFATTDKSIRYILLNAKALDDHIYRTKDDDIVNMEASGIMVVP